MAKESVFLVDPDDYFKNYKTIQPYFKAFYDFIREKLVVEDQQWFIRGVPMYMTGPELYRQQAELIYTLVREALVENGELDAARPY